MNSGPRIDPFFLDVRDFRRPLLTWYEANARRLPWRESRDPYRVWVSEIMLQQTRVAAVIEHYHEFLRRFPNVEKLAKAREASVLATWSGLGYYRRARMLHAAAQVITREHNGNFPRTAELLQELPGIGRYTAAAVASIAFGEPVAVVDGNVERVLYRLSGKKLTQEQLWNAAQRLLDAKRPGDFNQSMMELGATVCTPRAPACRTCPVVDLCATRGETAATKSVPQKKREIHYSLICRDNNSHGAQVFLVRRPQDAALMAGMWELPEMLSREGVAEELFVLRHSITVTDYTVHLWRGPSPGQLNGKWVTHDKLAGVALTGLARKILRKAGILTRPAAMRRASPAAIV
ncbi:MAG: A/G-specific adenine glycosylase [Candidatus Sulfotelmatobacter sp.]